MVTTVSPDEVTAGCAVLGVVWAVTMFVVNALIARQMDKLAEHIDQKYATKDELRLSVQSRARAAYGGD
jgi:hypothetical protein